MSLDPTKVFQSPCHLYLAARSDRDTAVSHEEATGWDDIGLLKPKSAKNKQTELTFKSHIGQHQFAVKNEFEVSALETDSTKKEIIEAAIGKRCDIILKPLFGTRCWKVKAGEFMATLSGEASEDDALSYDLKTNAVGTLPSDCFEEIEIAWSL